MQYAVHFSKRENVAELISAAARQGAGAIAPLNDARLLSGLDHARTSCTLDVYPIIPNALGYVRDATEYGMIGAGIKHVRRLSLVDLLRIGAQGLTRVRSVIMRDFRAILSLLIEMEMATFKRFRPPLVLLHGQVTDIAVALGNAEALRTFADVVRHRFGAEPGVVTSNFAALLRSLTDWGIDIDVILAPFNARGFLMKPTKEVCESLVSQTNKYVIADRLTVIPAEIGADMAYLRGLGIRSAMVDIAHPAALESIVQCASATRDERRAACP